jgi:uncharacterized protein YoxC
MTKKTFNKPRKESIFNHLLKKIFSSRIRDIEKTLENDPELIAKTNELDKDIEKWKKNINDYLNMYGR